MICPRCRSSETRVTDSRPTEETVKRRRLCKGCGYAWNTFEVNEGDYDALEAVHELIQSRVGDETRSGRVTA